jgi:hypothetical protein
VGERKAKDRIGRACAEADEEKREGLAGSYCAG